jgi:two-component system, chemotaxis family, sensor kinase CheA
VVIEVADDGAGINRPKVLESAKQKGLVPQDAQLSDTEIDNLLFLPGFSTASSVSNISGRGVGMDVVKRSIQALGGRISISSRPREGSTFSMSLPLTLAVLDGFVVAIGEQTFVIPLTAIVETLKPHPSSIHPLGEGSFVIRVRDSFVPLIDVGAEVGVRPPLLTPFSGVAVLVETENRSRNALLVDAILDQRQVVIKSLESNYGRAIGVAAATILGDGRVAMILDVDALVDGKRLKTFQIEELAKAG